MASRQEMARNNVRAGVFVTLSLILALSVVIKLSGVLSGLFQSVQEYRVTYEIDDGVRDLQSGSSVRVGGMTMGHVIAVQPALEVEPFRTIEVTFEIDSRITLYADAMILVDSPVIGSGAWLEISDVGSADKGPPPGGVITGTSAPGMLATFLGPEGAMQADEAIESVADFAEFLGTVPEDYEDHVVPTLKDIRTASANVREVTSDLSDHRWKKWADDVDVVMDWASDATVRVDDVMDEGKGLLEDARGVVAENREPIGSIVTNVEGASVDVREIAARVNAETIDKAHALLDSGQDALQQAGDAIAALREDYDRWAVDIGDTMANASLASQQLKFATIEVRRSPWKLLYRPSADELEHELLYESARSFALAAADLKAAAATVNRVVENHGDRLAEDRDAFDRVQQVLESSLDQYTEAQQRLLDVLVK
ncbi:MAG: MlaD family protein [Planctomycetota bacterium]|jgi:ABC-type transporter Mla subunit MlaD